MTKDAVHFAFKGACVEIDRIPLAEITAITTVVDSNIGAELNENGLFKPDGDHTIHVATEQGGFNSGRAYYFRTDSKGALDDFVENMRRCVRVARKHRDNHNILQRTQLRLRRVYESKPSKGFIILLIALVPPPPCPPPSIHTSMSSCPENHARTAAMQTALELPRYRRSHRTHRHIVEAHQ